MLYKKMIAVMGDVNDCAAERGELVEAIAIALLTRKNLFILGDTGQAKSMVINEFRRRITGSRQFERLMSKQADEEQLFGRVDLSSLIPGNADKEALARDPNYMASLDGLANMVGNGAATDDIAEQLKALDVMRQAAYAIHGNRPKLATAGKIPDSHIVFLDEIFKSNDGILNSLLTALNERRYTNEGETIDIPAISFFAASNEIPNFSNAEERILKALYDRLELKLVTEYVQDRDARLAVLRDKQAGLSGQVRETVTLDELCAMQGEVASVAIPESLNELVALAAEAYGDFEDTADTVETAKRIGKLRNEYTTLYEVVTGLSSSAQDDSERDRINEAVSRLEDYSRKAHAAVNYTYAPLGELFELRKTA